MMSCHQSQSSESFRALRCTSNAVALRAKLGRSLNRTYRHNPIKQNSLTAENHPSFMTVFTEKTAKRKN
jgi:hypothetical protein